MGAVSRFGREGLSRFDRDVVLKGSIVPEARSGPEPIKKLVPFRFQFPRRWPLKLKKRHARLRRSLTGAEGDFSVYVDARIPAHSRLECC
jgi:hypothetical protein